jgi:hypothetical protein
MRRWLATDDNSAVLMAHLRGAPVDPAWLSTYRRLRRDLSRSVGTARRPPGPPPARPSANQDTAGAIPDRARGPVACQGDGTTSLPRAWDHPKVSSSIDLAF